MQTFLPYPNLAASASVLDWRRLGKQRLEIVQLIRTSNIVRTHGRLPFRGSISHDLWMETVSKINKLRTENGDRPLGWANHACMLMWRNHIRGLMMYFDCIRREWVRRGYANNYGCYGIPYDANEMPSFIGDVKFHASHRSQLLAKDPDWYKQFRWKEKPGKLSYVWLGKMDGAVTDLLEESLEEEPEKYRDPWPSDDSLFVEEAA